MASKDDNMVLGDLFCTKGEGKNATERLKGLLA